MTRQSERRIRDQRSWGIAMIVGAISFAGGSAARGQETYVESNSQVNGRAHTTNGGEQDFTGRHEVGTTQISHAQAVALGDFFYFSDALEPSHTFPTFIGVATATAALESLSGGASVTSHPDASNLSGIGTEFIPPHYIEGSASSDASVKENFHFTTTNPQGSNYRLEVRLLSSLSSNIGPLLAVTSGEWGLSANAFAALGGILVNVFNFRSGSYILPNQPYSTSAGQNDYAEANVFIPAGGADMPLTTGLAVSAGFRNMEVDLTVNALHTAYFALSTDDPLASYTTDSGLLLPTEIPEPDTTLSIFAGIAALVLARRSRRCGTRRNGA